MKKKQLSCCRILPLSINSKINLISCCFLLYSSRLWCGLLFWELLWLPTGRTSSVKYQLLNLQRNIHWGKTCSSLFAAFCSYLRGISVPLASWKVTVSISIFKAPQVWGMDVNTEGFGEHFWKSPKGRFKKKKKVSWELYIGSKALLHPNPGIPRHTLPQIDIYNFW